MRRNLTLNCIWLFISLLLSPALLVVTSQLSKKEMLTSAQICFSMLFAQQRWTVCSRASGPHTTPVHRPCWYLIWVRSRRKNNLTTLCPSSATNGCGLFWLLLLLFCLFVFYLSALGLGCCAQAFSNCRERGATLRCSVWASHCGGFYCCGARAPGMRASVVVPRGLQSTGSAVVAHRLQTRRLSNCGSRAQLLRGMWDPPGPGLKPMSPALAGGFPTTAPTGKSLGVVFCKNWEADEEAESLRPTPIW